MEEEGFRCFPGGEEHFRSLKSGSLRLLPAKRWALSTGFVFLSVILLTGGFVSWFDFSLLKRAVLIQTIFASKAPERHEYTLNCTTPRTCTSTNKQAKDMLKTYQTKSTASCPNHFRWIHEDLRPWKSTGITRETLESASEFAYLRVVVLKGKLYVKKLRGSFQTRDVSTIWGIVQLLRLYPGEIPAMEMMFSCSDRPAIVRERYRGANGTVSLPVPPLVGYCGREDTLDIVFPDWTFWGWPETNVRPWKGLLEDIIRGNNKTNWRDRVPYAYWKGNPTVTPSRMELMKCNDSLNYDWGVRLYKQNWSEAATHGYGNSKLEGQCTHRYKIYIEGRGWSVSEKYILACNSMVLLINPYYYDFFTRSLVPSKHYWHISDKNMCKGLKYAVEWGNNNPRKAQVIGEAGSKFIQENLKMDFVYDYMFHLIKEYAKLLKFQPKVPQGAKQICTEKMFCSQKAEGPMKQYMAETMVKSPSDTLPCNMPPPYDPVGLQTFFERKRKITRQVEARTSEYWKDRKTDC